MRWKLHNRFIKTTIAVCFKPPAQGSWLIAIGVSIIPIVFPRLQKIYHQTKEKILDEFYFPFRNRVMDHIHQLISQGLQVWHLSTHSFTPVMNNIIRTTDIGLLYDPRSNSEKILARQWQKEIKTLHPQLKVRMNYPYKGISDGFTTSLRKNTVIMNT